MNFVIGAVVGAVIGTAIIVPIGVLWLRRFERRIYRDTCEMLGIDPDPDPDLFENIGSSQTAARHRRLHSRARGRR